MLSVRAPDDSPMRQVLWQDQFDFACLPKPRVLRSSSLRVHPTGCYGLQLSRTMEKIGRTSANLSVSRSQIGEKSSGMVDLLVAVAGNSCKPSSETAFVFKV